MIKQETERNAVVFIPTALWNLRNKDKSYNDYPPELKKERKLEKIAHEISDIFREGKFSASDVQQLCHIFWKIVYHMSVVGK